MDAVYHGCDLPPAQALNFLHEAGDEQELAPCEESSLSNC